MAYITQRPEEERQSLGGQGAIAGGSGGQGMSGAPAPQAGVSKGTGGSQPWVNIQNYLRANPNDQSASKTLQREFTEPLNKSALQAQAELNKTTEAINAQKAGAEQALSDVDANLGAARSAFRESILNKNPNVFGGATNRAVEASKYQYQSPEFQPKYIESALQAQAEQLKDPYGYISQQYSKQGLTGGQRALQEQLTRKSGGFPQIASAVRGQYEKAKADIENQNAAVAKDVSGTEESYRNKFSDAARRANQFVNNQADLQRAIGPGQQALYAQLLGGPNGFLGNQYSPDLSLAEIGKRVDAYAARNPQSSAGSVNQSQYKTLVDRLLAKYGFQ